MSLKISYGDVVQNEWDYIPVTISDESTGETISFRFTDPIEIVSPYVEKFANHLLKTIELDGKLITINSKAEKTI